MKIVKVAGDYGVESLMWSYLSAAATAIHVLVKYSVLFYRVWPEFDMDINSLCITF